MKWSFLVYGALAAFCAAPQTVSPETIGLPQFVCSGPRVLEVANPNGADFTDLQITIDLDRQAGRSYQAKIAHVSSRTQITVKPKPVNPSSKKLRPFVCEAIARIRATYKVENRWRVFSRDY